MEFSSYCRRLSTITICLNLLKIGTVNMFSKNLWDWGCQFNLKVDLQKIFKANLVSFEVYCLYKADTNKIK